LLVAALLLDLSNFVHPFMEVHLLRHTTPDVEKGICYGQKDVGVATSYEQELQELLPRVGSDYDAVLCSPLARCRRLAEDLEVGLPIERSALLELNFGDWEGRAWKEIPQEEIDRWMKDFVRARVPNGESLEDLYERVRLFLEDLRASGKERYLLVTHGGVIRCCWVYALGFPLENLFRLDLPFGSLTKLQMDAKGVGIHKVGP
jgi:alpha-ribazole phosphatase